jgi:hypothetical protein
MAKDFGDYIRGQREEMAQNAQLRRLQEAQAAEAAEIRKQEEALANERRAQEIAVAAQEVRATVVELATAYKQEGIIPKKSFTYAADRESSKHRLFKRDTVRVRRKGWELYRDITPAPTPPPVGTWEYEQYQINATFSGHPGPTHNYSYVLSEEGELLRISGAGGGRNNSLLLPGSC